MKIGEIFTTERIVSGGTGYLYAVVRLTGNVALVSMEKESMGDMPGSPEIQRFTFQFLQAGSAEIQLARFRTFELKDALYEDVLTFTVDPSELGCANNALGGWSKFTELSDEEKKLFTTALANLVGVEYTPSKVSKQIVNGVNYRFACMGKIVSKESDTFPAIITINVSPAGKVQLLNIERVVL